MLGSRCGYPEALHRWQFWAVITRVQVVLDSAGNLLPVGGPPDNDEMLPGHDGVWFVTSLPWVFPGVALGLAVGIAASSRSARWIGSPRVVAWALITSTSVILAFTLTPLDAAYRGESQLGPYCDFSRIGPAGIADVSRPSDALLNILLFIPLGFASALVPRSSRKASILAGAFVLPFVVEATQSAASPLGRGCESADVADNLTGLVVGLALGTLAPWCANRVRSAAKNSSQEPPHAASPGGGCGNVE